MEAQAEEWSAEAQKEKKLRERSEQYSRQLEEELEGMKVCTNLEKCFLYCKKQISYDFFSFVVEQLKQVGRSPGVGTSEHNKELSKLRADLEKKTVYYEEELSRRDFQHANELKNLQKELREAESQQLALKKEIMMLKDKVEKTRRER